MRITVAGGNFCGLGHFEKGEAMNALVKKEIRLLLPGWLAILLLEVLQPWFWQQPDGFFGILPFIFFFGIIILAVDSFGREFSLGTFQSLLAQPVERRRIWQTKTTILFFATTLIFAAYVASCKLRLDHGLKNPAWNNNPGLITDFHNAMCASAVAALVALVGGLWTALLFRQTATAFWISFLAPAGLGMVIEILLPAKLADNEFVVAAQLYSAAGAYIIFGFWLAHRLFHRAQDVAWTGGVISFSKWRYFEAASQTSVSVRRRKPISALLKKEFQLHSITLFFAGTLLVLHLAVFFLRIFYVNGGHKNSFADGVSMFFWTLWLVLPLTLGCMTVAEERKLGVMDGQFCLPASRRLQFVIKFIPTMFFGVLLGGVMPVLLEGLAAHFGAPNDVFKPDNADGSGISGLQISIVVVSAGLSLAAFFASTVARNFLQALSIAIVIIVGCCLFVSFISYTSEQRTAVFGIMIWPSLLMVLIAIPMMAVVYLWLIYRNFSHFHETRRLWRRNIAGIVGALLFAFVSSVVIYNRVWEIAEPAEPPHGAAKFSLANPPKLTGDYASLLVRLPDGRVWFDSLGNPIYENPGTLKTLWLLLTSPLLKSTGPHQFIDGSNWVSVTAKRIEWRNDHESGYLDTVGIQSNGTLWISSKSVPVIWTGDKMVQFGDDTNWQQVTRFYGVQFGNFMLLKNDGTLWSWGNTNHFDRSQWRTNWPSARTSTPQQIETDSDWKELWNNLAQKSDGSVWAIGMNDKSRQDELHRETNLDQVSLQTLSTSGDGERAYVRPDGTLWISLRGNSDGYSGFVRVGTETNWTAVALTAQEMVALKSDGSLWQWHFPYSENDAMRQEQLAMAAQKPPARLGIHNDWVAIAGNWEDVIALAADGSLWLWPDREIYPQYLLKLPKQPQLLGNVFGKAD
jgi:ABC-type transport system involved in multi-copper enzyme maturation permease subunit